MKRLLLILIALIFFVASVSANTVLNFQQPADFTAQATCACASPVGWCPPSVPIDYGTCSWVESTNGGNNYILTTSSGTSEFNGIVIKSTTNTQMTYSAATFLSGSFDGYVVLYDSVGNILWEDYGDLYTAARYEIRMVGGQAYLYENGVQIAVSGVLTQNPSNIGWGSYSPDCVACHITSQWSIDDIVWGSSAPLDSTASDKYVYGMPETQSTGEPYYKIMKDFLNPAASGFYYGNGSLINSNHFTSTFSKGNNNTDTIYLQGYGTGVNVLSNTTGTAYTGEISWDLTSFFAANPNYGLYAMHSPSSLKYSDMITYVGNGATITWNKPTYSQGESGAIITSVMDGGYWDPATYNYKIEVIDIYGVVQATYPVSTQTATVTHTWAADQAIGLYYAVIIATPKTGSSPADDIWMNAAMCNVDAYLTMYGYVFDAETTNPIESANVNITQGLLVTDVTTPPDGNYTATGMSQGATVSINVSATGYQTYLHQFTPLRVGSLELNFTLMPTSPTYSGVALGGVAMEPPYNRTIDSATIYIQNSTYGSFTATTNRVGYYILNDMLPNDWWNVWGAKTGFLNSTVYQKLVIGS